MKFMIVGLGNMHPDYEKTRHNLGFEVIDHLADQSEEEFKNEYLADIAEIKYRGRSLILIKPSTYMNRSGKAVRYWMQKKNILPENLLVVVDDMNLPFKTLRIRSKGSDGGHNGLKNIIECLGSKNYARLRIGIGRSTGKGNQINYVLGEWSPEEESELPAIVNNASKAVLSFCFSGISNTMNQYNS